MKKTGIFLLIIVLLAFSGCGGNTGSETGATFFPAVSHGNEAATAAPADNGERLQKVMETYGATVYFEDAFLSNRYLIMSDSCVVSVLFLTGTEIVTAVPFDSVARTENQLIGTFGMIKIYDKSGNSIEFQAKSDDYQKITEYLAG